MSTRSQNTIAARPSPIARQIPADRTALSGTFPSEPPLHLAAGTDSDDTVVCDCDYGCWECDTTGARK